MATGAILLILVGLASRLSLWLLVTAGCSVRARSYEDMVSKTLGERAALGVTVILAVLTWFVIIAYSILVGDLVGPVLGFLLPGLVSDAAIDAKGPLSLRTATMASAHLLVFPITRLPSMSSLGFTSAISLTTTVVLAAFISARSIGAMIKRGYVFPPEPELPTGPASSAVREWLRGTMSSASIVSVSFLCHFNLLPLSEELRRCARAEWRAGGSGRAPSQPGLRARAPAPQQPRVLCHRAISQAASAHTLWRRWRSAARTLLGAILVRQTLHDAPPGKRPHSPARAARASGPCARARRTSANRAPARASPRRHRSPTKRRFRKVIDWTTLVAGALYLSVGVLGSLQFPRATSGGVRGNVLLNYGNHDALMSIGRLALSLTVTSGIALMVHPCRSAIRRLVRTASGAEPIPAAPASPPPPASQKRPAQSPMDRVDTDTDADLDDGDQDEPQPPLPPPPAASPARDTLEAALIQASGLIVAVYIPEITIIWAFMGSTVSMLIAFVLPAACYLALRRWKRQSTLRKRRGAWVLLVTGSVLTVVCTISSISSYAAAAVAAASSSDDALADSADADQ